LDDDFLQYCRLNNVEDIEKLAKETFKKGFDILKYGIVPAKVTMVANEILPVIPTSPPNGLETLGYKPQKEDVTDTQTENKVVTPTKSKSVQETKKRDLYDE